MKILLVYFSETGHTQKVSTLICDKLKEKTIDITLLESAELKQEHLSNIDLLLIGTPVHGLFLFAQNASKQIRKAVDRITNELKNKKVIIFATYLFFPAKALQKLENKIKNSNGIVLDSLAEHRRNKEELANAVIEKITESS
ncbi:MAG: hypothetical protein HGN29_14710 [Asgard group archaeon]|nr:hypothetical protein [Asgard group archaeon]